MRQDPNNPRRFTGDGFEFRRTDDSDSAPSLIHLRHWSAEARQTLRDLRFSQVHIQSFWEGDSSGLEFLTEFADQITELGVSAESIDDLSVVHRLPKLTGLSVSCAVERVDFAQLPKLRECLLNRRASLGNVGESPALEDLALFKVRARDLGALRTLKSLRRLYLNETLGLLSLEGIEALPLEQVQLIYLRGLTSIAPLAGMTTLQSLEVIGCKKVSDMARIGEARSLRMLALHGPPLPSLEFLGELPALEQFALSSTTFGGTGTSIAPLTRAKRLRNLKLWHIKSVVDIERIGEMAALERLVIGKGPELPSLSFLRGLPNLRILGIAKTRVIDRDVRVLLELPRLGWVSEITPERPSVSPSLEEVNAVLAARHGMTQEATPWPRYSLDGEENGTRT